MSIDLSQFKQTFIEESLEGLDVMESSLLNLGEGTANLEVINNIFRAAHSIKGGSGTFGFNDIAQFTHVLETLLDQMRSGERPVTQHAVELLLASVDCLRMMIDSIRDSTNYDTEHASNVKQQLESLLENRDQQQPAAPKSPVSTTVVQSPSGWLIKFSPHVHMLKTGNDPVLMFRELSNVAAVEIKADYSDLLDFSDLNPEDCYLRWEIRLTGEVEETAIKDVFAWVADECDLEIIPLQRNEPSSQIASDNADVQHKQAVTHPEPVAVQAEDKSHAAANENPVPLPANAPKITAPVAVANSAANKEAASIRVAIDKVDQLINMVGELVITQSMLSQLGDDFDMEKLEKLRNGLAQLERNTRELQENVMRIRMLPISYSFNRFPRLVHDISQKLGKKVELKLSGEGTELDKTVMEKIGDPLVHLVRNALDHGIESPEMRVKAGKNEVGLLQLNAYHKGGNIIIEIADDGAGINKSKVINKALQKGIINSATEVDEDKIHELIFRPGFSTADAVSDLSGRGVGMDVVKKNIKELGGSIVISSTEGKGSVFSIRLPLTLAILDGQLVRVGDEVYIIPLISVVESLQIKKSLVNQLAGKSELYRLRDEYIPVIRLYEIFNITPKTTEFEEGLLIVVESDGKKVGLFVDDLLGQQQVVIKGLETNYKRVEGFSGATILGDGTVALIMDISGVIAMSKSIKKHSQSENASGSKDAAA
ncbi:MAG: chemotaxis protein CheA [Pseudomonadota bacterium]